MLKNTIPVALLALCLSVSLVGQDAPKLYDLSTSAKKGTTAWFRATNTMSQGQRGGGTVASTVERTFRVTIKQVTKNGGRIIEMQIIRAKGSMDFPDMAKVTFDSATGNMGDRQPGFATMAKRHTAGVGKTFTARVDRFGKLAGSVSGIALELGGEAGTSQSDLKRLVESVFGQRPSKAVPLGGTWKDGLETNGIRLNEDVTLKKIDSATFTTSLVGTIIKAGMPKAVAELPKEQAEFFASMKISNSKSNGEQRISRRDGLVEVATHSHSFYVATTQNGEITNSKSALTMRLRRIKKPEAGHVLAACIAQSRADAKLLADQVKIFYVKNGRLPQALAVLTKKDGQGHSYLKELPKDTWGNAYKLLPGDSPRKFEVRSAGPDGEYDTTDDISSRKN